MVKMMGLYIKIIKSWIPKVGQMLKMAFKSFKKMIKLWNSECGNGVDGLQVKNLSKLENSKCGKWW
jgi:hypothetical protein